MINHIAVIGAGTMGNGIAHVLAFGGYTVSLIDSSEEALKRAKITIEKNLSRQVEKEKITENDRVKALSNLSTLSNLQKGIAQADLAIEAITENPEVKLKLFGQLDNMMKPEAILASNTSSISITKIASNTSRPDKVIGMHFMNPVPIMKLVEIIRGYNTSDSTCKEIMELATMLGKKPVEVNDYPGFVANRILMPMINEAIYTLQEGVSGVYEIDTVMKLGMGHPMGPLQLADFIGLDICLSILEVLYRGMGNPKYAPCPLLVNMVQSGHKGVKTGSGFYNYTAGKSPLVVADEFIK